MRDSMLPVQDPPSEGFELQVQGEGEQQLIPLDAVALAEWTSLHDPELAHGDKMHSRRLPHQAPGVFAKSLAKMVV